MDKLFVNVNMPIIYFPTFYASIERNIIDKLYEYELISDSKFKNKDTIKIFNTIILREIYSILKETNCNCLFIFDYSEISEFTESYKLFNHSKMNQYMKRVFRLIKKHFPKNFYISKQPFSELKENQGLLKDILFELSQKSTNKILTHSSYVQLLKQLEKNI